MKPWHVKLLTQTMAERVIGPTCVTAFVLALGLATVSTAGAADPRAIRTDVVEPALSTAAQAGKPAYEQYCSSCHGVNAAGTAKGPTFIHRVYHPGHHGDRGFVLAARQGVRAHHWRFGDMKPVPEVTDEELVNLIRYIRELQAANGVF